MKPVKITLDSELVAELCYRYIESLPHFGSTARELSATFNLDEVGEVVGITVESRGKPEKKS